MNWDAIGAIGETVGSLAVVVTIAYLAIQIRQSGKAAKSVSVNQSRTAVNDFLRGISENTDAVNTYAAGLLDPDSLDLAERIRFDLIIFQTLRITETIFIEYRDGLVPAEIWEAQWRAESKILKTIGGQLSLKRQKDLVSTSFMEWIEENLDSA